MATNNPDIWKIKPHSKAKHEIIKKYLQAWFPIVGKNNNLITYIDGFCGPGKYEGGEEGSPIIALNVGKVQNKLLKGIAKFWFVDEKMSRLELLNREIKKIGFPENIKCELKNGKFNEVINQEGIQSDLARSPSFTLVDPFGFADIPFLLIKKILNHSRSEVLITFMVDSINRWLKHPDQKIREHIIEYFGTKECLEVANKYKRVQELRQLYQRQLRSVAKFVRYFEMRDFGNKPIYYLFFATNNRLGFIKMKEAMWNIDPSGEFRFSDATDPNQMTLMEMDPIPELERILQEKFGGKGNSLCEKIRLYVEEETSFLKKHLTIAFKKMEKGNKINISSLKSDGTKRRANTFPDLAFVQFL